MATGKLLTGNVSMTQGIKGYFTCCFNSRKSSEEEGRNDNNKPPVADQKTNGDSVDNAAHWHNKPKHKKGKKDKKDANGKVNAYNYDDADTSSDSDDEVLRRYQETMHRTPSTRSNKSVAPSVRSAAPSTRSAAPSTRSAAPSHKSTASSRQSSGTRLATGAQSPATSNSNNIADEELISLAEKGDVVASVPTVGSSPYSSDEDGAVRSAPRSHDGSHVDYANEAYTAAGDEDDHHLASSETGALSNNGDTASMSMVDAHDEHLFDVSDLERETVLISKCGNLDVTFEYDAARARIKVTIHNASEIPSKERGGASNTQVRLLLLPAKKTRHKTKIRPGENPVFDESFTFKVSPEEVPQMGVRFRLYGCERMRRERMIGESVIGFAMVNLEEPTTHSLALEPRSNLSHGDSKFDVSSLLSRSDSASSTQSMQHGGMPELLCGLAYNGTTGRLSVEVIKGSNFRNMAMNRAPDTYVKLTLMSPNGQEITRSKTSIRRGQPHPLFKETFMFQVALFQLADVTLMVSVYNKRSMKRKEMIGWFSLGYNNSGDEELAHWNDMRESKGEQVCRWHVLLEA